ncbi:CaiB/BaiF CoA transferase family protein [Bordetella muralis]|uniref:CaiB/BaiF CoA transferase family protein n=1 Tax=Bordetella muralis TaxID=1649130 RepID=UPI0039EE9A25
MPLSGIRVLDLTRIISGPYCTSILADMGAEVIKIETPGEGDPVRRQGVIRDGLSWYFANYNRNKKSVTLDLYSQEGKDILRSLIPRCDVIIENYRPGIMEKMGLGSDALKALRPDIIHCSINGFGTSGPYRDRPSFDFIAQAMSGFMSLNGAESDPPMRAAPPISDLIAGMNGALGVMAALLRRERTGRGDTVSVSLLSSMIGLLSFHAANYFANGQLPARTGNDHGIVAPYGLFETADGQVAIAPSNDAMYEKLLDALELQELRTHPDFQANADRMLNRTSIKAIIEARTRQQATHYWIERLNRYGVPCGHVMNLQEVFADPQVADQEMAIDVPHPDGQQVRMLGFPVKFTEAPCRAYRASPELGGDTDDVLTELGLAREYIAQLRQAGKI